ncbi:MAG: DUF2007 domain-containing protein [Sphingomicrobium sp.]
MNGLVLAESYNTRVEADLARIFLASHGISGVLFDAEIASYGFTAGGIRLMVIEQDLADARRLLRDSSP